MTVIFLRIWSLHIIFLCSLFLSYFSVNKVIPRVKTIMFLIDYMIFFSNKWYQELAMVWYDFFLSMLCGCSLVWSSTSIKINYLLWENHPYLLKLQWEIWWKNHCQRLVDAMDIQVGSWTYKDYESGWYVVEFAFFTSVLLDL